MKKLRGLAMMVVAGLVVAAAVAGGRAAFSDEAAHADADITQIKKDINTLLLNQQDILTEIRKVREELNVVKVRCSG